MNADSLSQVGILIACLNGLGLLLKRAIPDRFFQNRWIPLTLSIVGIVTYCALQKQWDALTACWGFIYSLPATGLHQLVVQTSGAVNNPTPPSPPNNV